MLGFFRKKKVSPIDRMFSSLTENEVKKIGAVAGTLNAQLMTSKSSVTYESKLQSPYARGYLLGYVEAALQRMGLSRANDSDELIRIIVAHYFILDGTGLDAIEFVRRSIDLQDDAEYVKAHKCGVDDLFSGFSEDARMSMTLARYFFGEPVEQEKPRYHRVNGKWVEKP